MSNSTISKARRNERLAVESMAKLYATLTKDEADAVLSRLADLAPDPDKLPVVAAVAWIEREIAHTLAWRGRE